jgi:tetratricopeptide (TPR) repeat protein
MTRKDAFSKVQSRPQDARAWLILGHKLYDTNQPTQARCCYQQALNLATSLNELQQALVALARDKVNWGPLAVSLCAVLDDVRANPADPATWTLLGDLLTEMGAPNKALECYQRVLEIDPIFTSSDPETARVLAAEPTTLPRWLVPQAPKLTVLPRRGLPAAPEPLPFPWPLTAA